MRADRPLHLRLQARALYERNGYELVGCVEDFPSGTDVLWYRKRLKGRGHGDRFDRVLRRPVAPMLLPESDMAPMRWFRR